MTISELDLIHAQMVAVVAVARRRLSCCYSVEKQKMS